MQKTGEEALKLKKLQQGAQESFSYGWNKAFNEYTDNINNIALVGQNVFKSMTDTINTAIDDLVEKGTISWDKLIDNMIKGMIKADVIANIHDRFTECSMIYETYIKGKLITQPPPPVVMSLQEDYVYYNKVDPFKALKRLFSLAKVKKEEKVAKELLPILNGDLGRLNLIAGDLKTLGDLLELHGMEAHQSILEQVDMIKGRIGNIYQLKGFLMNEHEVIGEINSILKAPKTQVLGKIERLHDRLKEIISKATVIILKKMVKEMD
jgi:hypothetical protein